MLDNILRLLFFILLIPSPAVAEISADHGDGGVIIGADAGETCNGTTEGAVRYDTTNTNYEYCDGAKWRHILSTSASGPPSAPTADVGYFVITAGKWTGNLGGGGGADAKCLSDLTANDWMGKTDASTRGLLDDEHVEALICPTSCRSIVPGIKYYFAVSGDNTKGGAYFITDASGDGPNNTRNWAGTNYFDGYKEYWSGYAATTSTSWDDGGNHGDSWYCSTSSSWTEGTSVQTGGVGYTNSSGAGRWNAYKVSCDEQRRLLCVVNP